MVPINHGTKMEKLKLSEITKMERMWEHGKSGIRMAD